MGTAECSRNFRFLLPFAVFNRSRNSIMEDGEQSETGSLPRLTNQQHVYELYFSVLTREKQSTHKACAVRIVKGPWAVSVCHLQSGVLESCEETHKPLTLLRLLTF